MQRRILLCGVLALAAAAATSAQAAKFRTATPHLVADATHIIVGRVGAISKRRVDTPTRSTTYYTAAITIEKVEKGAGLKVGNIVQARYFTSKVVGKPFKGGGAGHSPSPRSEGDRVRVYLVNKGYNGAGYTTDGGFDVYFVNGFEIEPQR